MIKEVIFEMPEAGSFIVFFEVLCVHGEAFSTQLHSRKLHTVLRICLCRALSSAKWRFWLPAGLSWEHRAPFMCVALSVLQVRKNFVSTLWMFIFQFFILRPFLSSSYTVCTKLCFIKWPCFWTVAACYFQLSEKTNWISSNKDRFLNGLFQEMMRQLVYSP